MLSVVTRQRAGRSGFLIPVRAKQFPFRKLQTGSGAHPASYSIGTGFPLPGVNWTELEVNRSPPYCVVVKNEWRYTSTPFMASTGKTLPYLKRYFQHSAVNEDVQDTQQYTLRLNVYWTCIIIIVEELETNLMSLVIFITLNICSTCFEH